MAAPTVKVEGGKELVSSLRAAGVKVADLKPVHEDIERTVMVPRSRAAAPRGPTGRLAASVRGSGTKEAAITRAGSSKVPYGRPIHWGWPAHHIRPQRFIWDTIEQERPEWTEKYRAYIRGILARVKGV